MEVYRVPYISLSSCKGTASRTTLENKNKNVEWTLNKDHFKRDFRDKDGLEDRVIIHTLY